MSVSPHVRVEFSTRPCQDLHTLVLSTPHVRVEIMMSHLFFLNYGILGNLLQSGLRFSRNAFPPSCASSVM